MWWILLLLCFKYSSQTLAPPPVNFSKEIVIIDGENFIVRFDGNSVSLDKTNFNPDWFRPSDNDKDNGFLGCLGCGTVSLFLFWFWLGILLTVLGKFEVLKWVVIIGCIGFLGLLSIFYLLDYLKRK